jgi:hypothetical protein
MDKYRRFLDEFNINPFASRQQINNYKERLARENPAMLNIEPADSDHENSDSDANNAEESAYIPNVLATMRNNTR